MPTDREDSSDDRIEFLLNRGIEPKRWPLLSGQEIERLQGAIDGLVACGYTPEEACKVAAQFPQVLTAAKAPVRPVPPAAKAGGFPRQDAKKAPLHRSSPRLHQDRHDRVFKSLVAQGFARPAIRKIVERMPGVRYCTPTHIYDVLKNLETYGFYPHEIRKIVQHAPAILCCKPEHANGALANLVAQGFTRPESRLMVKRLPTLLCTKEERANEGIAVLRAVGLDPRKHVDILMPSPALLRGRIAVLQEHGVSVTRTQLKKTNAEFAKAYGLDRDAVLARDPLRSAVAETQTAP